MKKVMIVEDEKVICEELCDLLKNAGYEAEILTDFAHSVSVILDSNADLVLLDINIPDEWRAGASGAQTAVGCAGDHGYKPYGGAG